MTKPLDHMDHQICAVLVQASKRDKEKGGTGHRSAGEIADSTGYKRAFVRARLDRLFAADLVECAMDGPRVYFRAKTA